jgi:uncharacterized protein involved in outer membrane biogenesis
MVGAIIELNMRRILLALLALVVALIAIAAGFAWYATQNESFLKSQIHAFVLKQTGRELEIDGLLRLDLGRETTLEAEGIRFANAAWADNPEMARIGRLRVAIDVPSLFVETPIVRLLVVEDCSLDLVKNEHGEANWDLWPQAPVETRSPAESDLPVLLMDAQIRNCRLSHASPSREQPLSVEIRELSQQLREDQGWQIRGEGKIDGETVGIDGWMTPAGALVSGGPMEHELALEVGAVALRSSGTVQDAATGRGANIEMQFNGPEIARVLSLLDAPPVSSGPFDFRLSLNTEGELTRLDVDGNLGTLRVEAEGELDRLVRPSRGQVKSRIEGPSLAALGGAFGVENLAPNPYELNADVAFEPGSMRFRLFELDVRSAGSLSLLGVLGTGGSLAGTDLDLAVQSEDASRWAKAIDLPATDIGSVALSGRLLSDANGRGTLWARVELLQSILIVDGTLGLLAEKLQPDLRIDLHADDPRPLAGALGNFSLPQAPLSVNGRIARADKALILENLVVLLGSHNLRIDGRVNPTHPFLGTAVDLALQSPSAAELGVLFGKDWLPVAPIRLTGQISRADQRIRFEGIAIDLDGHQLSVDGTLDPEQKFSGSEFDVGLDTPDVAALALMFGKEGLPHEPMTLDALLKPEGKGLRFQTRQGDSSAIRLTVDGHIPDLDQPLALDADFDIHLPSLAMLGFLAPKAQLPELPLTAAGRLHNRTDRTELDGVRLDLGDLQAGVEGQLYPDRRFALSVEASGPDASQLEPWLGWAAAPKPFSLSTRLSGDTGAFELGDIDVRLGESRASGELQIGLGKPIKVSGALAAPYLDLSRLFLEETESADASAADSPFVFDDTPLARIDDYGLAIDAALSVAEADLGNSLLHDVQLNVLLANGRLEVAPFSLRGLRGGTFHGSAIVDDSGAAHVLQVTMDAKDLRLGLSAAPGQDPDTYAPVDLQFVLHGTGSTRREMASSLDGTLRAYAGSGLIASSGVNLLFSDFLTELFVALDPMAKSSEFTRMECSVFAADIVAGTVALEPAVIHLEQFTVISRGTIDLRSEKINLSFNTKPRKGLGITPGTVINTLIKVGGTLKAPAIELDPAGAIVAGTLGVATVGLSVVAKGFSDRFLSSKDPCGDARKEIEKRDR